MKIALIEVGHPTEDLSWTPWIDSKGRFFSPTLGPIHMASLTRPHDEVRIIDEKVDGPADDVEADLVGISFKSMYARRAYELADKLRKKGIKVVLGGLHASLSPAEAGFHADALVVGEGESTFPDVLTDFDAGRLKKRYYAPPKPTSLRDLKIRYDLVDHDKYMVHSIQSARGCSFGCEFCPTKTMFGEELRQRRIENVAREAEQLLAFANKPIFFTENVFGAGDLAYVKGLTERLRDLGAQYGVICDFPMVNPEIVNLLAKGGCNMMLLNLTGECSEKEVRAVQMVRDAGMGIWGYFMFGFETDKPYVFENTVRLVQDYDIGFATLTVLSPYPGTPMGERLRKEERVFDDEMAHYDQSHVVFRPAHMTAEQLQTGYDYACRELSSRLHVDRALELMTGGRAAT